VFDGHPPELTAAAVRRIYGVSEELEAFHESVTSTAAIGA
jgi:hypothetical protein